MQTVKTLAGALAFASAAALAHAEEPVSEAAKKTAPSAVEATVAAVVAGDRTVKAPSAQSGENRQETAASAQERGEKQPSAG